MRVGPTERGPDRPARRWPRRTDEEAALVCSRHRSRWFSPPGGLLRQRAQPAKHPRLQNRYANRRGQHRRAINGTVLLAADFNDVNLAQGENLVSFLQGSGTLNAGYCESTAIDMIEVVGVDVLRIMGTGKANMYSNRRNVSSVDVGFGQHGYVVTTVDLRLAE